MGEFGKRGNGLLHVGRFRDLGVGGHGPDRDRAGRALDAAQLGDAVEVDEVRGRREALLHRGQEGVPAGHDLGLVELAEEVRGLPDARRAVEFEGVHGVSLVLNRVSREW